MPGPRRSHNGGPAVAPRNRAAILTAARQLFTEQGYHVPLSAIAKAAGVGQGVLYRHFPDRFALAFAVFSDNFEELEAVAAATQGPGCFHAVWRRLVDLTIESTAFVDLVIEARAQLPGSVDADRLARLVTEPLARAQAAGLADPAWTTADILLLVHMVHGVVTGLAGQRGTAAAVDRALRLVDPRLLAPDPQSAARPHR